ncbi:hypothetical protein BpHYR1_011420 [Brachionus plicatilis]|uniref:Uncharacterized protein n=1 Tax=Brachionus plicatilis TaxID=10195 RepID=A0A3M7SAD9_BRAPC|nr:hypothetical protein BpHYR1_011420 [Brachionus plicatilis]
MTGSLSEIFFVPALMLKNNKHIFNKNSKKLFLSIYLSRKIDICSIVYLSNYVDYFKKIGQQQQKHFY